jgi:hypothetical protein
MKHPRRGWASVLRLSKDVTELTFESVIGSRVADTPRRRPARPVALSNPQLGRPCSLGACLSQASSSDLVAEDCEGSKRDRQLDQSRADGLEPNFPLSLFVHRLPNGLGHGLFPQIGRPVRS